MLRMLALICGVLTITGFILFYVGMSAASPYEHAIGAIGITPIIGACLFLLGIAGAMACFTTWLLTTMVPNPEKEKE